MGAGRQLGADRQLVAAGDAGGWMQQNGLTDRVAFRIERFLYPQRPAVPIFAQHGAFAVAGETEMQFGVPAR